MGTAISTRFCTSRLPTGKLTSADDPTIRVAQSITAGPVTSVMTLLKAVSDTDKATSPPASMENTLLELPPGLQAINMIPKKNMGSM